MGTQGDDTCRHHVSCLTNAVPIVLSNIFLKRPNFVEVFKVRGKEKILSLMAELEEGEQEAKLVFSEQGT